MSDEIKSRREFLKFLALTTAALPLSGMLTKFPMAIAKAKAKEIPLPDGMAEVQDADPVVIATGYKKNVKDIDYVKYPHRKLAANKNQNCKNCQLFTKLNDGWGKCQMLQNGVVSVDGWCGSWSKKQATS